VRRRRLLTISLLGLSILLTTCASLPADYERTVSQAFVNTGDTRIGRAVQPLLTAHPQTSGFYLLDSGIDAFIAR